MAFPTMGATPNQHYPILSSQNSTAAGTVSLLALVASPRDHGSLLRCSARAPSLPHLKPSSTAMLIVNCECLNGLLALPSQKMLDLRETFLYSHRWAIIIFVDDTIIINVDIDTQRSIGSIPTNSRNIYNIFHIECP